MAQADRERWLPGKPIRECEGVVEIIKELSKGINGFNEDRTS